MSWTKLLTHDDLESGNGSSTDVARADHEHPSINSSFTSDSEWVGIVPEGWLLDKVVLREVGGNAVTDIKIGYTSGDDSVVSGEDVGANGVVIVGVMYDIDWSIATSLFVSASGWNSGEVEVKLIMSKLV